MATSKRSRKKPAKRQPKKPTLIHFTAMHKGTARPRGKPGDVWVLIGKPTWMKYKNKGVSKKTKTAALRALKKFKAR
jgi:hypothetical protein